jgi:hypothetical protein
VATPSQGPQGEDGPRGPSGPAGATREHCVKIGSSSFGSCD